ncbi:MAG: TetR/AcrR family transcriptional regulator [bacterium]|nr:TetR/AcrR family transcriptional regulator [bacterium]
MQNTKRKLLDSAARLFHERSYEATGVATILREAGVNSGSLYHFFPNKEALLHAVLARYQELLRPVVLDPIEEAEADPIERVFRLLDWYRQGMLASGCRQGCPIGNLALEVSDTHPGVRDSIDTNFRNWAAGIREWLDGAADRLPTDCDRDALSVFVLTVMEGGLMQARAQADLAPYDASVAVLRDHFDRLQVAAGAPDFSNGGSQ